MQLHYTSRPASRREGRPPLLVLLHGAGGNEHGFGELIAGLDRRLLVLRARAPFANAPGAYRWFDVRFSGRAVEVDPAEAEHSRVAVLQFINDAVMGYGADPRRVYLLGFSQGATLAYSIALTSPARLRGLICIAGRVLPEIAPLAAPPRALRHLTLLIQQGARDPVQAPARGRAARDLFVDLGVMLGYREYPAAHELSAAMAHDVCAFLSDQLDRLAHDGDSPAAG